MSSHARKSAEFDSGYRAGILAAAALMRARYKIEVVARERQSKDPRVTAMAAAVGHAQTCVVLDELITAVEKL